MIGIAKRLGGQCEAPTPPMPAFDKTDIRHQGAYTLAEAARYLKLPQATLRAWAIGRD